MGESAAVSGRGEHTARKKTVHKKPLIFPVEYHVFVNIKQQLPLALLTGSCCLISTNTYDSVRKREKLRAVFLACRLLLAVEVLGGFQ